jgi:hypothetical protein
MIKLVIKGKRIRTPIPGPPIRIVGVSVAGIETMMEVLNISLEEARKLMLDPPEISGE